MKKLILLFCVFLLAQALHAQTVSQMPQVQKPYYGFKGKFIPRVFTGDTSINFNFKDILNQSLKTTTASVDNMPVAGLGQVVLTYQGNNGQGFDIYRASPDNLPILKPDSAFYSAMPVAGKKTTKLGEQP